MNAGAGFDPTAPLTPSGNLRRRQVFSRVAESGATLAAVVAVGVLAIVIFSVVENGASALSLDFLIEGAPTGIGPAILGTGLIVAVATAIAMPSGILVGLPSIIIGLFVFGLLVDHKQQSAFAASVALAIIELPMIARGSQEVLMLVPDSMREAADALGVSRWRTVLKVILPSALGGIMTSTVLAVARAAGETAPLILLCSVFDPRSFSGHVGEAIPNIPVMIFQLSEEGNPEGFARAWGAGLVLVAFILFASLGARALLARSKRKLAS
jgi:phosphate transport system permease protein